MLLFSTFTRYNFYIMHKKGMPVIRVTGTGTGCEPLVLAELNGPEKEALARLAGLAEQCLDEIPFPGLRSRRLTAERILANMRAAFSLPVRPAGGNEDR
jgi:hypothetical protein